MAAVGRLLGAGTSFTDGGARRARRRVRSGRGRASAPSRPARVPRHVHHPRRSVNVAERQGNPFLRSARGGRVLSGLMLPHFTILPPAGFGVLTTTGRRT